MAEFPIIGNVMFKQRVITAVILIPLVLCLVLFASEPIIIVLLGLITLIAAAEWIRLIPLSDKKKGGGYLLCVLLLLIMSYFFGRLFIYLSLALWPLILIAVMNYDNSKQSTQHPFLVAVLGTVIVPASFIALYTIIGHSRYLFIYFLIIIWVTDSGAYVFGKLWGKHKLIPAVSPGKTIEGLFGGVLTSLLVAVGAYLLFVPGNIWCWMALSLATALISVLGDLFISLLKRKVSLKDTGHLFPGHGGMLDRIDSLLAGAPVFAAAIINIGQCL